jgi:uncharacterized protein YjbI with pentapeptide repeats
VGVVVAAVVVLGALSWFVVVLLPGWTAGGDVARLPPAERLTAVGAVRTQWITWTSVITGLGVGAYGVYRFYLDKDKQRLDQDKHLTGLFDSATGRLESDDPTVRAGGLRTLFRLMTDSPRDHQPVVDTLCDVLRQRAADSAAGRLPRDVVAAADALRDRPDRPEIRPVDLAGVRLPGVRWPGIRLPHADLGSVCLDGADLTGAVLTGADLAGADLGKAKLAGVTAAGATLKNAVLTGADLSSANLRDADLTRARLQGATVAGADFTGADLTDADLRGVDLRTTTGLTGASLERAVVDGDTVLPVAAR